MAKRCGFRIVGRLRATAGACPRPCRPPPSIGRLANVRFEKTTHQAAQRLLSGRAINIRGSPLTADAHGGVSPDGYLRWRSGRDEAQDLNGVLWLIRRMIRRSEVADRVARYGLASWVGDARHDNPVAHHVMPAFDIDFVVPITNVEGDELGNHSMSSITGRSGAAVGTRTTCAIPGPESFRPVAHRVRLRSMQTAGQQQPVLRSELVSRQTAAMPHGIAAPSTSLSWLCRRARRSNLQDALRSSPVAKPNLTHNSPSS